MLGSFPPELVIVSQHPVYSGRRNRRCHVISLQTGCRAGVHARIRPLAITKSYSQGTRPTPSLICAQSSRRVPLSLSNSFALQHLLQAVFDATALVTRTTHCPISDSASWETVTIRAIQPCYLFLHSFFFILHLR